MLYLSVWDGIADAGLVADLARVHDDFRLIDRSTFYWYDLSQPDKSAPQNPIEELAQLVVRAVAPPTLAGCEYWTNTLAAGERMHRHQDKDEKRFWRTRQVVHPHIGTVFYPRHVDHAGGDLVVNGETAVPTAHNRLVAFRGDLAHEVRNVESGSRHSIAINLWTHMPDAYKAFLA